MCVFVCVCKCRCRSLLRHRPLPATAATKLFHLSCHTSWHLTIPPHCSLFISKYDLIGYWKFEKWKVKLKSASLISRSVKWNENLVHSFREWEVKWKSLLIEIENEKWNGNGSRSRLRMKSEMKMPRDRDREVKFSRILEKFLRIKKSRILLTFGLNAFHEANLYSRIRRKSIPELICLR